jgi:hypothetical protein
MGRKDIEDAVLRLDVLTKEESLMVMARNLEVTQRIDGVVHEVARNVDSGTQLLPSVFAHSLTSYIVST